jgi:hypothetical protein
MMSKVFMVTMTETERTLLPGPLGKPGSGEQRVSMVAIQSSVRLSAGIRLVPVYSVLVL